MRPVNLIPTDERRGSQAHMRRGPVSYVAIGAMVAILAGVTAVLLTNRQIADRKAELVSLEQRQQAADAKIQSFQSFASLRSVADQRVATVTSLAQSRFDWERVMHELSRVLPSDVWLTSLSGTVRPGLQLEGAGAIPTRDSVAGPALEMVGCAESQDAVARFVSDLKDIDGVTRVGVFESKRPELSTGATSGASGSGAGGDCRTKDTTSQFRLVAAFDRVSTPQVPQAAPGSGASAVQTEKARTATNLVPK
jgi:Tfp pilus assembly protein PilN